MVWEKEMGLIKKGMCVHHKNGKPQDNRIENLELLPFNEHSRQHQTKLNSFLGKKHTDSYKIERSKKYQGNGNPRYLKNVSTEEIIFLRNNGFNWCQISRHVGISRCGARKRFMSAQEK
jgi:hypothetical protein